MKNVNKTIFWIGLIGGGIYLFYNYNQNSTSSSTYDNSLSTETDETSTTQDDPLITFNNISIDSEISTYIDTSKFVAYYEFDENIKTDLKRILSDTNPDPENKVGTSCGQSERKCKWCPNTFYVDETYSTIYSEVKKYIFPENVFEIYVAAMSAGWAKNDVKDQMIRACSLYRNGERYYCNPDEKEFCSERCQQEYKMYHN